MVGVAGRFFIWNSHYSLSFPEKAKNFKFFQIARKSKEIKNSNFSSHHFLALFRIIMTQNYTQFLPLFFHAFIVIIFYDFCIFSAIICTLKCIDGKWSDNWDTVWEMMGFRSSHLVLGNCELFGEWFLSFYCLCFWLFSLHSHQKLFYYSFWFDSHKILTCLFTIFHVFLCDSHFHLTSNKRIP